MANEIKYQINGQLADNTVTEGNSKTLLKAPRSVTKTIYIGTAPSGGGGESGGGDGSLNEDPLG